MGMQAFLIATLHTSTPTGSTQQLLGPPCKGIACESPCPLPLGIPLSYEVGW